MTALVHGGDPAAVEARWGRPAGGWLDLSTGINPVSYPLPVLDPAVWQRLPQRQCLARLLDVARDAYGAPPDAAIVAAPGTQALIQLLPRLKPGAPVAVLGPTYAEHAACWAAAGMAVTTVPSLEAAEAAGAVVIVAVNPNNPDGRTLASANLLATADRLAARDGFLIVDEAFADAAPACSVASAADRPGLVVLRSFGKFFGLAGVRLGFALGDDAEIARLAAFLGPWAVSGPAIAIGCAALADRPWQQAARLRLVADAVCLHVLLAGSGLIVRGGTSLFCLAEHVNAPALHDRLGRAGILVRAFADRPTLLRFGLPPDAAAWRRLETALMVVAAEQ
jgi:cobalamin biosynthetic protein CobC